MADRAPVCEKSLDVSCLLTATKHASLIFVQHLEFTQRSTKIVQPNRIVLLRRVI